MTRGAVPCVVVGGTSSGVGKTSIAVGLMSALREKGLTVQAFKVGPDFIDPLHHEQATGRPSINLDGWMLTREQVVASFHRHTADADVAVVEGVMGLFDGRDGHSDAGSTAQVAKWLDAPVLLVLDCSAIARSAAAQVKGYIDFDPALRVGGLLFNKVGGEAHTRWMADAISSAGLGLRVLGGIPKDEGVVMKERYLGLHLPGDEGVPPQLLHGLARLCREHVDLDALVELARTAAVPPLEVPPQPPQALEGPQAGGASACGGQQQPVRIAVARDAAFCFYYQENLTLLQQAGAELVFFSPLKDTLPPGISGVYLGGGYPERYALDLADNRALRAGLRAFTRAGGVVYAECGGLLFLSRSVQPQDEAAVPMVGVFPFKTVMGSLTMAYVEVETSEACPLFPPGTTARGHVHHRSQIVEEHVVGGMCQGGGCSCGSNGRADPDKGWATGYVAKPQVPGAPEVAEGFCAQNVLASYVHLHFGSCPQLAAALVGKCRQVDVAAADAAAAEAATAAGALGAFGDANSMRSSPQMHRGPSPGLLPVRSSPNLLGGDRCFSRRASSVDHPSLSHYEDSHYGGGRAAASLDFSSSSHHGLGQRHHGMHLPVSRLSPATTLAKVLSSGSLSNSVQSGTHHSCVDPHALHAVDPELVSPLSSNSPSTSPREMHADALRHAAAGALHSPAAAATAATALEPYASGPIAHVSGPHTAAALELGPGHGGGHMAPHHGYAAAAAAPAGPPQLTHSHSWSSSLAAGYGTRRSTGGQTTPPQLPLPRGHPSASGLHWAAQHAQQQQQQQQHLLQHPARPRSVSLGSRPGSFSSMDFHAAGLVPLHSAAHPPGGLQGSAAGAVAAVPSSWHGSAPQAPSDKVAALGAGACEMLWALGLGSRVVAVSEGCDHPPDALMRARALRRAGGPAAGLPPLPAVPSSGRAFSTRSSSLESIPSSAAEQHAQQVAAGRAEGGGVWLVDEQVLARERPGLIVYEEEEEEEGLAAAPPAPGTPSPQQGNSPTLGAESGAVVWPASSFASATSAAGAAAAAAPDYGGGSGHSVGRVGQAILDALVAVGLQQSCRVVCIRRRSQSEVLESMLAVGEAAGVGQEAVRAVDRLRARLRQAAGQAAMAAQLRRRPRVLLLRSAAPLCTVGWWASDLVALAGGANGEEQPGDPAKVLTWEQVKAFAPEVLVVASLHPVPCCPASTPGGGNASAGATGGAPSERDGSSCGGCRALKDLSELAARPGWWQLPAVKEGRVFVADHALLCRPGPRLVDGVEALARMLHEDDVTLPCCDRAVLKLSLRPGQRCRHRVLPNYFTPFM